MTRIRRLLLALASALLCAALAPAAGAADGVVLPPRVHVAVDGSGPAVAVDAAGTAHVAFATLFRDSPPYARSSVGYCRVPAGATACDLQSSLTLPGPVLGGPVVVSRPDGLLAVVAMDDRVDAYEGGLYLFTSSDAGATWSPPTLLMSRLAAGFPEVLDGALRDDGRVAVLLRGDGARYTEVDPASATATAPFDPSGVEQAPAWVFGGALPGVLTGSPVASVERRTVLPGGAGAATADGWSPWSASFALDPSTDALQAVSGSADGGLYALTRAGRPRADWALRLVRQSPEGSVATGAVVAAAGEAQAASTLALDAASRVHVARRTSREGCPASACLVYRRTHRGGVDALGPFAVAAVAAPGERFQDPTLGVGAAGQAWLAWTSVRNGSMQPVELVAVCVRAAPLCGAEEDAAPSGVVRLVGPAGFVVTARTAQTGRADRLTLRVTGAGIRKVAFRATAHGDFGGPRVVASVDASAPFTLPLALTSPGRGYDRTRCATQATYTVVARVTLRQGGTRVLSRQLAYCPFSG